MELMPSTEEPCFRNPEGPELLSAVFAGASDAPAPCITGSWNRTGGTLLSVAERPS
jgi:hypothetical protein